MQEPQFWKHMIRKASQGIKNMKFGSCNLHFSCKVASMATKFNFLLIMIRRWQVFSSWLGTGYCFLNTAWCHIWGKNGARVMQKGLFEAVWVAKKWYVWCNLLKTCLQNCAPHRGRKHNFEKMWFEKWVRALKSWKRGLEACSFDAYS